MILCEIFVDIILTTLV